MIDAAISHIAGQLNQYLKSVFELSEDVVVISNILEQDGNVASHINNKLVVFLVNIERDTSPQRQSNGMPGGERAVVGFPPIYLNLYLMFAGHFSGKNYPEALKFVSNTIAFFQGHPVFDHHNSPDLDRRIDKLVLDIENLNLKDLGSLWGALSGKYLPSVLYKIRMVSVDAGDVKTQVPTLKTPQNSFNH